MKTADKCFQHTYLWMFTFLMTIMWWFIIIFAITSYLFSGFSGKFYFFPGAPVPRWTDSFTSFTVIQNLFYRLGKTKVGGVCFQEVTSVTTGLTLSLTQLFACHLSAHIVSNVFVILQHGWRWRKIWRHVACYGATTRRRRTRGKSVCRWHAKQPCQHRS